jgi:hypothetical protein
VGEVLIDRRPGLGVEVAADHKRHVLGEDEGLDLLQERDGLPKLDGGAGVVGVEVGVHHTQPVHRASSLRLWLRETSQCLQDHHLGNVVFAQPADVSAAG